MPEVEIYFVDLGDAQCSFRVSRRFMQDTVGEPGDPHGEDLLLRFREESELDDIGDRRAGCRVDELHHHVDIAQRRLGTGEDVLGASAKVHRVIYVKNKLELIDPGERVLGP